MTNPVSLAVSFIEGASIRLAVEFKRPPTDEEIADGTACGPDDWQPIDPDLVTAKVGKVVGGTMDVMTITEHAYIDSPGDIVRDDVGEFHLDITAGSANTGGKEANYWVFRFESFGNGAAAAEGTFRVSPSAFP